VPPSERLVRRFDGRFGISVLFLVVHAVECGTHGKRGSLFFVRTFELLRW
jgi:hypothetical protein